MRRAVLQALSSSAQGTGVDVATTSLSLWPSALGRLCCGACAPNTHGVATSAAPYAEQGTSRDSGSGRQGIAGGGKSRGGQQQRDNRDRGDRGPRGDQQFGDRPRRPRDSGGGGYGQPGDGPRFRDRDGGAPGQQQQRGGGRDRDRERGRGPPGQAGPSSSSNRRDGRPKPGDGPPSAALVPQEAAAGRGRALFAGQRPLSPAAASAYPPSAPPRPQQQPVRWDLAATNTPQRALQLIGDPRSGVVDDTTQNPFGEVTVDMVHHQLSNEVYWFKYEFAGGQLRGSHRDSRLSDYTKNLMYLMRAKDPKRWTISALADKFRIRRQRVLAILALKELEAQRIEDGKLLSGPLSPYGVAVHLDDVHLHPHTGEPMPRPQPAVALGQQDQGEEGKEEEAAAAAARRAAAAAAVAAARELHVDAGLPQVLTTAQQLQLQLLALLRGHSYDMARVRQALAADLDAAVRMAAKVFGLNPAAGAAGEQGGEAAGPALPFQAQLDAYRAAVEGVVVAVEGVVADSPYLQEERLAAELRTAVEAALAAAGPAVRQEAAGLPLGAAEGGAGSAGGGSDGLKALREALTKALQPAMAGDDASLQRLLFTLAPPARAALLRLLPALAVRLNAAGVDMARAAKDPGYRGPAAAAVAAAAASDKQVAAMKLQKQQQQQQQQQQGQQGQVAAEGSSSSARSVPRLPVDLLGFAPVPEQRLAAVEAALDELAAAAAALQAAVESLDPGGLVGHKALPPSLLHAPGSTPSTASAGAGAAAAADGSAAAATGGPLPVSDLRRLRALVREYVAADAAWADAQQQQQLGGGGRGALGQEEKRRMATILAEADPSALDRLLQVEAVMRLRKARDDATAEALERGAAARALADMQRQQQQEQQEGGAKATEGAAAAGGKQAAAGGPSWDAVAAYLDARVAGRVYGRGSGERHVTRLATYPAFEGYSLEEFDRAAEGELSALNRLVAERTEGQMYDRFRSDLLYNLGARGEKLRDPDPGQTAWPTNLRTELVRPMVVYGIGPDGTTQYPPLYVATPNGGRRPLNEQEQVYQERRLPRPRLPYYMGRVKRMTEL